MERGRRGDRRGEGSRERGRGEGKEGREGGGKKERFVVLLLTIFLTGCISNKRATPPSPKAVKIPNII